MDYINYLEQKKEGIAEEIFGFWRLEDWIFGKLMDVDLLLSLILLTLSMLSLW